MVGPRRELPAVWATDRELPLVPDEERHCPVPALVVHDEGDEEVPFQHGLALVCVGQHAELLATRDCGHQRLVRNPAVIQRIVQFVA